MTVESLMSSQLHPDILKFELGTVLESMYKKLQLPLPTEPSKIAFLFSPTAEALQQTWLVSN